MHSLQNEKSRTPRVSGTQRCSMLESRANINKYSNCRTIPATRKYISGIRLFCFTCPKEKNRKKDSYCSSRWRTPRTLSYLHLYSICRESKTIFRSWCRANACCRSVSASACRDIPKRRTTSTIKAACRKKIHL